MNKLHPAVKAVIKKGKKILIIKQKLGDGYTWDLPGGKVNYGEDPYDTLRREVWEEVRLSIEIIKPVGVYWFFRQDGDQLVCTTFLCQADRYETDLSKNPTQENIIEYKWVEKGELLSGNYSLPHRSMTELFKSL